jgi:hypothetical protein
MKEKQKESLLKFLLAAFCVVNVMTGIIAFSSDTRSILFVGEMIYGVKLPALETHTLYAIRMMGCLLLGVAVMCGIAVKKPARNKAVIYGLIVWLVMRAIQRVLDIEPFHQAFGTSYIALWWSIIFVSATAAAFFLLMPKKNA